MIDNDREYWVQLLEKLNACEDIYALLGDVLKDLCDYFGFGASFIYQAEYTVALYLVGSHSLYETRLPRMITPDRDISAELLAQIAQTKLVAFRDSTPKDALAEKLGELFAAKSMVLVPVVDQHRTLLALVGIVDRRGEIRHAEKDISFIGAVLTTLGTYLKTQLYQQRIERTRQSLEIILENMGVFVYVNDFDTHEVLYANKSMAAPYGGKEAMLGRPCWESLYDNAAGECSYCPKKELTGPNGLPTDEVYTWDYQRPHDGNWLRVLSAAVPWVDGRLAMIVSSIDITDNKRNEEIIRQMAEYDFVTGLPNRFRLTSDFDANLSAMEKNGREGFVLFLDLDGFKMVNDNLGHDVGDELLGKVGQFLQSGSLTGKHSYRYGGDEFVVLVEPRRPGQLTDVIDYLLQGFSEKWRLKDGEVSCKVSIGVSHYPFDGTLTSNLLRRADQAMYSSKQTGREKVHFYNNGAVCALAEYKKNHPSL